MLDHLGQHHLGSLHLLDDDAQAGGFQGFLFLGHAVEGFVDQPGQGIGLDVVQVDAQQAFDLEQRGVAAHQQLARLVGQHTALGLAVFVLDVADQRLQHVFHGQVADHLAVGLLHQGEVHAALAELLQQGGQRHVPGDALDRADHLVQIQLLRQFAETGQFQQQVLDVHQADELAAGLVVHRIPAVLVAAQHAEQLVEAGVALDVHQVFAGVGPVGHFQLAHLHRRGQHADVLVAGVVGAAGVQDQLQLVAAVVMFMVRPRLALAGEAQDGVGAGVEQEDRRVHRPVEQVQRHRRPQRQQLRLADGPGLGRQLADHDVQVGNQEERDREGGAVDDHRVGDTEGGEQRLDQVREGRLADPAQAQRGQGDAQLAGRQVGVELAVHGAQDVSAPAMLAGDGLHLGRAQLDHGEFGGHEETVEQNEEEGEQDKAEIGEVGGNAETRGRVHGGSGWPMIRARWLFARAFSSPTVNPWRSAPCSGRTGPAENDR